jgi:hypothetical protein
MRDNASRQVSLEIELPYLLLVKSGRSSDMRLEGINAPRAY